MSVTMDNGHIPNGIIHLPELEAFERRPRESSRYPACTCCPYGYHIDLDFVRYCDALTLGADSASKQRRRHRRRQRHSMDVLLGLSSPNLWSIDDQLPEVPQEDAGHHVDPLRTDAIVRDALSTAVQVFEDTLQRTHKEPSTSYFTPVDTSPSLERPVSSQDPNMLQDFDVASVGSAASGLSTGALQTIREQMAVSLERMRELEEQVKLIPILQVQLSVLKEEKRKLLLQQKADEAEKQKLLNGLEKAHHNMSEINRTVRDKSVMCATVTRDVGVSHKLPKTSNASTSTRPFGINLGYSNVAFESIAPEIPLQMKQKYNRNIGVNTEVHFSKLYTEEDMQTMISNLKSFRKPSGSISHMETQTISRFSAPVLQIVEQRDSAIQVQVSSLPSKSVGVQYEIWSRGVQVQTEHELWLEDSETQYDPLILTSDVQLQSDPSYWCTDSTSQTDRMLNYKDISTQVEGLPKRVVDVGITAKSRCSDAIVEVKPITRERGSSDCTIVDVICDKCKVKKRTVAVGPSVFEDFETKPQKDLSNKMLSEIKNRTVTTDTKSTDMRDLLSNRTHEVATNTSKRKYVDASVGGNNPICVNGEVSKSEQLQTISINTSRIPRPMTSPNLSLNRKVYSTEITSPSTTPTGTLKRDGLKLPVIPSPAKNIPRSTSPEPARQNLQKPIQVSPSSTSSSEAPASDRSSRLKRQNTYTKLPDDQGDKISSDTPTLEQGEIAISVETMTAKNETSTTLPKIKTEYHSEILQEERTMERIDSFLHREDLTRAEPSKEMKAALKVINDYLTKSSSRKELPEHLNNAKNIVQQEWFKISGGKNVNPLSVEDYLDYIEGCSSQLLEFVVNMADMNGNTALHYAVSSGNFDVVSILLDSKVCDINKRNAAGYTCVMLATLVKLRSETHRQIIRRMFHLADVNIKAVPHGQTALMLATSHGSLEMVEMLTEAGADMNIQDADGSTALMCAADHGFTEIVKHIISQPDCDVTITDSDGSTALNIAMESGNRHIGLLLYAHEHFGRGSSPHGSLRFRRSRSTTPTSLSNTPSSPLTLRDHGDKSL